MDISSESSEDGGIFGTGTSLEDAMDDGMFGDGEMDSDEGIFGDCKMESGEGIFGAEGGPVPMETEEGIFGAEGGLAPIMEPEEGIFGGGASHTPASYIKIGKWVSRTKPMLEQCQAMVSIELGRPQGLPAAEPC